MTLIWALDEIESQEPVKEQRALWLLEYLSRTKARVVISTVIVGELLVQIEPAKHTDFIRSLSLRFDVVPYDVRAASRAAEKYQDTIDLKTEGQGARKLFKSDLSIVAQAWASGATAFYSDDERCRKLARRVGMVPRELPTERLISGEQVSLFTNTPRGI